MRTTSSYIKVSNEVRAKLARLFKVEEKTVYLALTYRRDSEKARKIRYAAVRNYGGVAMCHCPECETLHEIREGERQLMVQNFDNGIKLEIDKQTGAAVMYDRRGAVVCRRHIEKFPELSELQLYAESL
ncbi:hypothetical protein [Paramuribaculum intestinale]|uniref:hypothetical protein n=1 Tax=Paramuribaculum intestinale TaxID=2094151 RepID=UPI00263AEEA0|nr:hypothetical protein [Paramuribaculum intestinale]